LEELMRMRAETDAAVRAVADAYAVSVEAARTVHAADVRRVRELAWRRAEKRGTDPTREMLHVARAYKKAKDARRRRAAERRARHSPAYRGIVRQLGYVRRYLSHAAGMAIGANLAEEERAVLRATVDRIRTGLRQLDHARTGRTLSDWDAELQTMIDRGHDASA
jgi:hypothetical protein